MGPPWNKSTYPTYDAACHQSRGYRMQWNDASQAQRLQGAIKQCVSGIGTNTASRVQCVLAECYRSLDNRWETLMPIWVIWVKILGLYLMPSGQN
jgi:hypothetical protein